jgi:glycine oxidase
MESIRKQGSIGVVGGGIIGMSVAWRLAQAGFAVTVYEKSMIGGEASWAGAGMLAPGGEFEDDSALARMAVGARDLYRSFVDELQRESSLEIDFQETGALEIAYSAEELKRLGKRAEAQLTLGIPSKGISPEQIGAFWPHVNREQLAGGYFYPGDAAVDPRHVMSCLRMVCEKSGVVLAERSEVKSVIAERAGVLVADMRYDGVVIAAGAWSGMVQVSGVPALPKSEPVRGHLIGYQQPKHICNNILRRDHIYLLQRANGLLIVGASVERVGFDRSINRETAGQLEELAARVMPHLRETCPTEVWNGFRPGSDELHLGAWHSSRLYLAYGHYRNGILLAPMTAQLLVAEISANLQKP